MDPQFDAVKAQAESDRLNAIQAGVTHDTASLLARYGGMQSLALAGAGSGATQNLAPTFSLGFGRRL